MEELRCTMAGHETEDAWSKGWIGGVAVEMEDPRCKNLAETLMLEVDDPRCRREAFAMEDPRCNSRYLAC